MANMPAWSHTSLTTFEQCPRRYYRTKVAKDVKEDFGEEALWGQTVHKHLETRLKEDKPLPDYLKNCEPIIQDIMSRHGERVVEEKIALDANFKPVTFFAKNAWARGVVDVGVVNDKAAVLLDWKGLTLETEIPTPTGFKAMKDLMVGDYVFGSDGKAYPVINKSQVHSRPSYRVEFHDKTFVECDYVHLWKLLDGKVVAVTELERPMKIELPKPVEYPETVLPIDPYVLGLWLADGKHTSSEICKGDDFVWQEIERRGYTLGAVQVQKGNKAIVRSVLNIRGALSELNVLGNKHIPDVYLYASVSQRIDLIRGLMDGDGNANPSRKQCVFTSTNKHMSNQVKQLLESLGVRVNQATVRNKGFGKDVVAYPLAFASVGFNPFLLPRKAERVVFSERSHKFRRVSSVTPIGEKLTQCIEVASPDNTFLCTRSYIVTHNTGKRKPDNDQMRVFAAFSFARWPWVEKIMTGFVWLKDNKVDKQLFTRQQDNAQLWSEIMPRVKRLEAAYEKDSWPAKPSGLCRGWCPVKSCEHWEPKKK